MALAQPGPDAFPDPGLRREDHFVVLHDVTWSDYKRLLALRGEGAKPRITYLEGRIEIMSPSRDQDSIARVIGSLLVTYCIENGVVADGCGSWTLKNKREERGAEPDECFVFGADTASKKRPDLAIEVEWTSGSISKLDVYRRLGVKEVWYWRRGAIIPYVLRGGRYQERKKSALLPEIDLAELTRFAGVRPLTAAVIAYRDALRARAKF